MSHILRQSTQVIVRIGCFMDSVDGVTPETGVTLGAADQAEALKAAGAATADISGNTWAAITGAGGWYDLTLTTTDTNTVGDLTIVVQDTSVCLPVFARFQVVEEAVYDQLYAAAAPGAATTTALATAQTDLDDIQTRLPAPLTTGTSDSGTTTTMVDAARTEADTDYWKGSLIRFTSGAITGQTRLITAFTPGTDTITFAPATTQAVGTQTYEILPAGAVDVRLWNGTAPNNLVSGRVDADMGAISTDSAAADALETMLDGTGGNVLTLSQLRVNSSAAGGAIDIDNSAGPAISARTSSGVSVEAVSTGGNGAGIAATGQGSGQGIIATGGATGDGVRALGGATSGDGIHAEAATLGDGIDAVGKGSGGVGVLATGGTNAAGISAAGAGTGAGVLSTGGATGHGVSALGGATSGDGVHAEAATSGDGIDAVGKLAGVGLRATGGASGHGMIAAGGGTSGAGIRATSASANNAAMEIEATNGDVMGLYVQGSVAGSGAQFVGGAGATGGFGMEIIGGAGAHGLEIIGGDGGSGINAHTVDNGNGISAQGIGTGRAGIRASAGTNGHGIIAEANGTGHGINATGGNTGHGARFAGGLVSGDGIHAEAQTLGDGIEAVGAGGGFDINADIQGSLSGNVVGSVGSVAAGGITAASIATNAIDADALATDAVDEIVDAVWDESLVAHNIAGSTGEALSNAAVGSPTAADVADAVWDEARAGHVAAGSFGEGVASVQGNVTGSVGSVTGNVGGNVTGSVGSIAAGGIAAASFAANSITASALASDAADEIIAAVSGTADSGSTTTIVDAARTEADTDYWAGSIVLITSGSTQGQMRRITAFDAATDTITVDPAFTQAISTNTYIIIRTAIGTAAAGGSLTQQQVRDAMKLAPTAGAPAAGSVDEHLDDILADTNVIEPLVSTNLDATVSSRATPAQVNTEVDTALADIRLDEVIQNAASPITPTIDSFWDRITSKNGAQTYDRATDSLEGIADSGSTPPSAATIADAVWDELRAGHVGAGSFGEGVASVQGNVTGSVASVTGNVGGNVVGNVNGTVASVVGNVGGNVVGNVNGSVASVAANGITAASLDATASSEIADQVWEEAIADHSGTVGSTAEALAAAAVGGSAPTVAQIADGVWDELIAGHLGVGSTGESLNNAGSGASAATIADAVWDEALAGHLTAGSTGEALDTAASGGAGLTQQQVADALLLAPAGVPAAGSVYSEFDVLMGPGFNAATDSLEEIRDEIDNCCAVTGGVDEINIEGI